MLIMRFYRKATTNIESIMKCAKRGAKRKNTPLLGLMENPQHNFLLMSCKF